MWQTRSLQLYACMFVSLRRLCCPLRECHFHSNEHSPLEIKVVLLLTSLPRLASCLLFFFSLESFCRQIKGCSPFVTINFANQKQSSSTSTCTFTFRWLTENISNNINTDLFASVVINYRYFEVMFGTKSRFLNITILPTTHYLLIYTI